MTKLNWVLWEDNIESEIPPRKAIVVEKGEEWSLVRWKDTAQTEKVRTSRILVQMVETSTRKRATSSSSNKGTSQKRPKPHDNGTFLPQEILLTHVLPFLRPRELLNAMCTQKFLLSRLSHEIVIQSAMQSEGYYLQHEQRKKDTPAKRMREIAGLLENGSIRIPSPPRLLRLLVGTRCEQRGCDTTCQMRPGFALFMCSACRRIGPLHKSHSSLGLLRYFYPSELENLWPKSTVSIMTKPYVAPSGELAGPFATVSLLQQLYEDDDDAEARKKIMQSLNRPSMEEYNRLVSIYHSAYAASLVCQAMSAGTNKRAIKNVVKNLRQQSLTDLQPLYRAIAAIDASSKFGMTWKQSPVIVWLEEVVQGGPGLPNPRLHPIKFPKN